MNNISFEEITADLFSTLGNPFRIRILMEIGEGEACVCHLVTVLEKRQAFISQHLMAMREAGLLETRRDGKYIFYRLSKPNLLNLIHDTSRFTGSKAAMVSKVKTSTHIENCVCQICRAKTTNTK